MIALKVIAFVCTAIIAVNGIDDDEIDKNVRPIQPFGDENHAMFNTKEELDSVCRVVQFTGMPSISQLLDSYGRSSFAVQFVNQMTLFAAMIGEACAKSQEPGADAVFAVIFPLYKEVAEKNNELKPFRVALTNALYDASLNTTKARIDTVLCYLNKWIDQTTSINISDGARNIMKAWLHGFTQYVITSGHLPAISCEWSQFPAPPPGGMRSLPMMMIRALANVNTFEPQKA